MEQHKINIMINQYINGELSNESLVEFEQLLESDPQLAKEVLFHKKVDKTLLAKKVKPKENEEQQELFKKFGEKYITNEAENIGEPKVIKLKPPMQSVSETRSTNSRVLKWLAPVIGLAAASLLVFFVGFNNVNPEKLAQTYFEPFPVDILVRGGEANTLTEAQQAYDAHDYEKALDIFSQYPNNNLAIMAKGNCEFLLDQPKKAIATFKLLANKNTAKTTHAQWYLALSYLKQGDVGLAKNNFKLIPSNSNYYEAARKILSKLKDN